MIFWKGMSSNDKAKICCNINYYSLDSRYIIPRKSCNRAEAQQFKMAYYLYSSLLELDNQKASSMKPTGLSKNSYMLAASAAFTKSFFSLHKIKFPFNERLEIFVFELQFNSFLLFSSGLQFSFQSAANHSFLRRIRILAFHLHNFCI